MDMSAVTLTIFGFICILSTLTDATTEEPRVELLTQSNDVLVGSTVLLFCRANKIATFKWLKDGEDLGDNIEDEDEKSKLTLKNVKLSDSGNYTCLGDFEGDEHEQIISIYVYETPTFGLTKTYHEFLVNRTVQVPCLVTGKPEVEINWYWNNIRVINNETNNLNVLRDGTLQITNIQRENHGTYVCEGKIKRRPKSQTLNISVVVNVPPTVIVRGENAKVVAGPNRSVSLTCLVTGTPHPVITWEMPDTSDSSRYIYNSDKSKLTIPGVAREDSGKYVCTGANKIGKDNAIFTLDVSASPGEPTSFTLSPGPSAFHITLQKPVLDGGSPITQYIIQWKNKSQEYWNEIAIPYSGPLEVTSLEPYTEYFVRFAAKNKHFLGGFSDEGKIRTLARQGEPDVPVLLADDGQIEKNTYSVPFKQLSNGGAPIKYYVVRYRMRKEGEPWREKETDANSTRIHLQNLEYDSDYEAEIFAVNVNGFSKTEKVYFTIPQAPHSLGKGGVAAIVLVIFLLMLFGVDALCCYTNHCGMINFLARKLFGPNMSDTKSMEEGVFNNVAVTMNGLEKQRGSIPKLQPQNKTGNGVRPDVTCDKAPLTKFEKEPANADSVNEARL